MKAYVESYGCTLNEADARIIKGILIKEGVELVEKPELADIVFLNTCAVKNATENRMISRIQELNKYDLVVCGCLPRINPERIREVSDCVMLDTNSLDKIPLLLEGQKQDFFSEKHLNKLELPFTKQGLIAVLPIAEGCLGNCAFCATKNARGRLTSYPKKHVKAVMERLIEEGAREIRLTAEDTGVYGWDKGTSLHSLLEELVNVEGDFKIRVGMMEPFSALKDLEKLSSVFESPKIYDFAHVPVQSGSDDVLVKMQRKYSVDDFIMVAKKLKEKPFFTLATDIIVGFPGETEEDFDKTLGLLKKVRPGVTNVSMFYPRPKTKAGQMKKLPTQQLKARSRKCSLLTKEIALSQNNLLVGHSFEARVLERGKKGGFVGRLPNYKQVLLEDADIGKKYNVLVSKAFPNYVKVSQVS